MREGTPGLDGRLSDSPGCWGQAEVPAVWLSHGLAFLGTPSESESAGFSPGPFTPWSGGCTPSLMFARVSC